MSMKVEVYELRSALATALLHIALIVLVAWATIEAWEFAR
jgi:hypothetical protein